MDNKKAHIQKCEHSKQAPHMPDLKILYFIHKFTHNISGVNVVCSADSLYSRSVWYPIVYAPAIR